VIINSHHHSGSRSYLYGLKLYRYDDIKLNVASTFALDHRWAKGSVTEFLYQPSAIPIFQINRKLLPP
jgi:hypothetical protein